MNMVPQSSEMHNPLNPYKVQQSNSQNDNLYLGAPGPIFVQNGLQTQNQLVSDIQNPEMIVIQNNNQNSYDHQDDLQKDVINEHVEPHSMMSELFASQTQNAQNNAYQVNYGEQNIQNFGINPSQ